MQFGWVPDRPGLLLLVVAVAAAAASHAVLDVDALALLGEGHGGDGGEARLPQDLRIRVPLRVDLGDEGGAPQPLLLRRLQHFFVFPFHLALSQVQGHLDTNFHKDQLAL